MKNILERLGKCKSRCQACREFGFYENGVGLRKLQNLIDEVGFDIRLFNERFVYSQNVKKCKCCEKELDFLKRGLEYCSQSCSAKVTNVGKIKTQETKNKIRLANIGNGYLNRNYKSEKKHSSSNCSVHYKNCKICKKIFVTNTKAKLRKTCSRDCQTIASVSIRPYQNGSRKNIYYTHKILGIILLESSWEEIIAKYLDKNNINWIRPKPLKWVDKVNKSRLYFSDFYLTDFDIYLDPKNPYCIDKDKNKLEYFENKINLIYGRPDNIINKLESEIIRRCSNHTF
jgi:hypothetical protein